MDGFLEQNDLERELLRQRALCDRTNARFVLITFALDGTTCDLQPHAHMRHLAESVRERMRTSDVAGWTLAGHTVGLLLPGAPQEAAQVVIAAVEEAFRKRSRERFRAVPGPELICDVYMYPSSDRQDVPWRAPERKTQATPKIVPFNRPSTYCVTP